jgi:hypothetical protein
MYGALIAIFLDISFRSPAKTVAKPLQHSRGNENKHSMPDTCSMVIDMPDQYNK